MKKYIFLLLFAMFPILFAQEIPNLTCGTANASIQYEANRGGYHIPSAGTIRALVIFAQFKDDNSVASDWPLNQMPNWATSFIPSLSQYFIEMSNGSFNITGEIYPSLVISNNNMNSYNAGTINKEIIQKVDAQVDFTQYDNWSGKNLGSDGKVDLIIIIHRGLIAPWLYTGIAELGCTNFYVDGKLVEGKFGNNPSGVYCSSGAWGLYYMKYLIAHEIGHLLLGPGHIDYLNNSALMTQQPVWNGYKGMMAWERERLNWISYTEINSDTQISLADYVTDDAVVKIPVSTNEYFLIENRQKISPHDEAGDKGIYIYHITNAHWSMPNIDMECADGNWNFSYNTTTKKISKPTSNRNGYDEMNYSVYDYGLNRYVACYQPYYEKNSAWGDDTDAFDPAYNNIFSPYSNPASTNGGNKSFYVELLSNSNPSQIKINFTNMNEAPISKPMNLRYTNNSNSPNIIWDANNEPNLTGYEIYRDGDWIATVSSSTTNYTDLGVQFTKPIWAYDINYRVKAVAGQKKSIFSNALVVSGKIISVAPKINDENRDLINIDETEFENYISNYPNPFNPVTTIGYTISEAGMVSLKIYNTLGQEVAVLVNEQKQSGKYQVQFNAVNLPSGVYFSKLQVGTKLFTKKLLLTK